MVSSLCLVPTRAYARISFLSNRLPEAGRQPGPGNRFEVRVPAAGVETVAKTLDKNGVKSNEMLEYKVREVRI
jgi:hypothetical protein